MYGGYIRSTPYVGNVVNKRAARSIITRGPVLRQIDLWEPNQQHMHGWPRGLWLCCDEITSFHTLSVLHHICMILVVRTYNSQ